MLIDSHCHLDFPILYDNLNLVLERAAEAKITCLQTICTRISEFDKVLNIAQMHNKIFCSVGVHPLNVYEQDVYSAQYIMKLSEHPKVIGIGETGLDYHYDKSQSNQLKQQESFINHINASQETGLPIIIHTRDADLDTVNIIKSEMKRKIFTGVIHCFTASSWLAQECLDMGLYISASGIITFKNALDIQYVFANLPLDRVLIETDSPFLAPVPLRGKSNEPSYLKHTAEFLSGLRKLDYEEVANATTLNFLRLFNKVPV